MHPASDQTPLPALWQELVEHVPVVVYLADFDETGTLRWISPHVQRLLGHPAAAFLDDDELWYRCVHPEDVDRVRAEERRVHLEQTDFECEYRMIAADGRELAVWERDVLLRDDQGVPRYTQGVVVDVTARHDAEHRAALAEQRADYLACHDQLTDLPNRALLQEHLAIAIARARRDGSGVGLIKLDIDDFSLVNAELGFGGGDRLLQRVAARLGTRRRSQDVLARLAGDEFAILLTGLDVTAGADVVLTIAEEYRATLRAPFDVGGTHFEVDACIGCAVFPTDAPDGDELQRRARLALTAAKHEGPGSAHRFHASTTGARRPLALTTRLRRAMERGELVLHWQPVFEVATGVPVGAEALVRWQTADGLLGPGEFVPYAEESRLIERLDEHVLELACEELTRWNGIDRACFGVNVSAHSFAAKGYADRVVATVAGYGIDRARLLLELTESAIMSGDGGARRTIQQLAEAGIAVAIDDFGTGFSTLARIIEMPFAVAKLDRSFLARGADDPATAGVIASMVAMTRRLGGRTLVEGVETQEQLDLLVELGVPLAQGFLLGRPAPAAETFPRLGGAPRRVAA